MGAAERRERLGSVGLADRGELAGDLIERLLPRDPLPAAFAARPDPLERVVDTIGMLVHLEAGRCLDAQLAPGDRILLVADVAHRPAVIDLDEDPAVLWAERAERSLDVFAEGQGWHLVSLACVRRVYRHEKR